MSQQTRRIANIHGARGDERGIDARAVSGRERDVLRDEVDVELLAQHGKDGEGACQRGGLRILGARQVELIAGELRV